MLCNGTVNKNFVLSNNKIYALLFRLLALLATQALSYEPRTYKAHIIYETQISRQANQSTKTTPGGHRTITTF
jgi:hypothetical protein